MGRILAIDEGEISVWIKQQVNEKLNIKLNFIAIASE
jgi:hypothetical protein